MATLEQKIIEELKLELEYQEPEYFGRIFQPNRIFVPVDSVFRANASGFSFQPFRS